MHFGGFGGSLGPLLVNFGLSWNLLGPSWGPLKTSLKASWGPLGAYMGKKWDLGASWGSLGAPKGAQNRFWSAKIMPWKGPGPPRDMKIFILRGFRACRLSSPRTARNRKEALRNASGSVWEHHFRPKMQFYEGFGEVALRYDIASEHVF